MALTMKCVFVVSDDRIKNVDALNSYLQTEEDRREMSHRGTGIVMPTSNVHYTL
jgi:hypothetical protein